MSAESKLDMKMSLGNFMKSSMDVKVEKTV